MNKVLVIRAAILAILSPLVGLGSLVYLLITGGLASWHVPLVVCLVFGPMIAWDRLGEVGSKLVKLGKALEDDQR